jgi:putative hemolysin
LIAVSIIELVVSNFLEGKMFELIVIIICLLLNAILSCVEMAFVTVSKVHLKSLTLDGDRLAKIVLNLKANPERVLSVLQIGITLVGAISAAVGGAGAEESLAPIIQNAFQISEDFSESLSIIIVVIPITFLSVVIGELVPKTLALRFPMKFAKFGGTFLHALDKIFSPMVYLLEISTKIILRPFLKKLKGEHISEVSTSVEIDGLSDAHKQYVLNLIDVDRRKVKDIMLPWENVIKINIEARPFEVLEILKKSGHTRIPILEGDDPIGVLHSKEFISQSEISKIDWLQLVRPALYVSPGEPILNALKILQNNKYHMAVVKNKNSKPIGIVTMEDIFEEIVGEIYDEDDNPSVLLSSNSRLRTMNLPNR